MRPDATAEVNRLCALHQNLRRRTDGGCSPVGWKVDDPLDALRPSIF